MSREIYNEGRVVGYSAYEIYLKNHLLKYPNIAPASENQWLTANIGAGASMILKIDPMTQPIGTIPYTGDSSRTLYVYRATLPRASVLASATNLYASYFAGNCEFNSNGWATKVIDYGAFISNTSTSSPGSGVVASSSVPYGTSSSAYDETKRLQMMDYMKIVDGGVVQAGEWPQTSSGQPFRDFMARFDQWGAMDAVSVVLVTDGKLNNGTTILISGFQDNFIVSGNSSAGGSTSSGHPQDGDFLGPACIPWACKISFSIPTEYYTMKINYTEVLSPDNIRFIGDAEYSSDGPFTEGGSQRPCIDNVVFPTSGNSILKINDVIRDPNGQYWKFSEISQGGALYYGWNSISESAIFTTPHNVESESVIDLNNGSAFYDDLLNHEYQTIGYNSYKQWKNYENIMTSRPTAKTENVSHDHTAILQLYSRSESDPPSLYYGEATQDDPILYLNPVNIQSPGTVKMLFAKSYNITSDATYKEAIRSELVSQESKYPGTTGMILSQYYEQGSGGGADISGDSVNLYTLNANNQLCNITDCKVEAISYGDTQSPSSTVHINRGMRYIKGSPSDTLAKSSRVKGGWNRINAISLVDRVGTSGDSNSMNYSHPYVNQYDMYNRSSVMSDDILVSVANGFGVSDGSGGHISEKFYNSGYLGVVDLSRSPIDSNTSARTSSSIYLEGSSSTVTAGPWQFVTNQPVAPVTGSPQSVTYYVWVPYVDGSKDSYSGWISFTGDQITYLGCVDSSLIDTTAKYQTADYSTVTLLGSATTIKAFANQVVSLSDNRNKFYKWMYHSQELPSDPPEGYWKWTPDDRAIAYSDEHSIIADNLNWSKLFDALQTDADIDLLGDKLKQLKYNMCNLFNADVTTLNVRNSDKIYVDNIPFAISSTEVPATMTNTKDESIPGAGICVDKSHSYLQLNKVRVYFSKTSITASEVADSNFMIFGLGNVGGSGAGLYWLNGSSWNKLTS